MKTAIRAKFGRIFPILILCAATSGCLKDPSHIPNTEWEWFRVVYLVNGDNGLRADSWSTSDEQILTKLRQSFQSSNLSISYNIGMRKDNRVDIRMANGQKWVIAYHPHVNSITVFDPIRPKRSYHMDITPHFFDTIKKLVQSESGTTLRIPGDFGRDAYDAMTGPDAARYQEIIWK